MHLLRLLERAYPDRLAIWLERWERRDEIAAAPWLGAAEVGRLCVPFGGVRGLSLVEADLFRYHQGEEQLRRGGRVDKIVERYGVIGDDDRDFDVAFWQAQGDVAIFEAAFELIMTAHAVKEGHAFEPRLDRSVEEYGPM